MTLPDLPNPHENPWFDKRQAFDLAVKEELEGRLSEPELSAAFVARVPGPGSFGAAATRALITAAANAVYAAGGGTVRLPGGVWTVDGPLPVLPGVTYEGEAVPAIKQINNVTGQWLADGKWDCVKGTVIQGDGTFSLFPKNNVAQSTVPANIGETEVPGFGVRRLVLRNFLRAIDIGAENQVGLTWGTIEDVWISDCVEWGINLVNFAHMNIRRITTQLCGDGHRYASHLDNQVFMPANSVVEDLYDTTISPKALRTHRGIWFEACAPRDGDDASLAEISGRRVQSNRFNVAKLSVTATFTAATNTISVPDATQFRSGFLVRFLTTVGNIATNRMWVVKAVDNAANMITIAPSFGDVVTTPSASGTATLETWGYPSILVGGTTPGAVINSFEVGNIDSEGRSGSGVYFEAVRGSKVSISAIPVSTDMHAAVVARRGSTRTEIFCGLAGVTDFDASSSGIIYNGARTTSWGRAGKGLFFDDMARSGALALGGLGDDVQGGNLHVRQGGFLYPVLGVGEQIRARDSAITLSGANVGHLVCTATGSTTYTLPTIADQVSNYDGSHIGAWFEISNLGTGTLTINTAGSQLINAITGKTSVTLAQFKAVRLVAVKLNSGALGWLARAYDLISA